MAEEKEEFITIHKGSKSWQIPKDWVQESDWNTKERQIAKNKAEAAILNNPMTREEVLSKFIDEDDYTNSPQYKKLRKENSELINRKTELAERKSQIAKELEKESTPKPKSEWDDNDEIEALLGMTPVKYTEKGKQLEKEYDKVSKEFREVEHQFTDSNQKLSEYDKTYIESERNWWNKYRPDYKKGDANKEYKGFATKTRSGYDNDLAKGIGFIAEMSPKEYLQRISYDVFGSTWARTFSGVSTKDVLTYMQMMKEGTKFDMPSIIEGSGQEGRHRAMAAYLLGIELIPVYVKKK